MSLLALILRLASGGARFLFVVYLAKVTSPSELGAFGLTATLSIIVSQIAGLELNQVVARRYHSETRDKVNAYIVNQFSTILIAYIPPLFVIAYMYGDRFGSAISLVCAIVVLEHFLTEVYRLLIIALRIRTASLLIFTKNVAWMLAYLVQTEIYDFEPSIFLLLANWTACLAFVSIVAIVIGGALLRRERPFSDQLHLGITRSMLLEARPFMASSFAVAFAGTIDRLLVEASFSSAQFGIYFFYATCASIISLIVTFSIGATVGPRCIQAHASGDMARYHRERRMAGRMYWLIATVVGLSLCVLGEPLIRLIKGDIYTADIFVLYIMVIGQIFLVNLDPLKLDLYTSRKDVELFVSNCLALTVTIGALALVSWTANMIAVASAVTVAAVISYALFARRAGVAIVSWAARLKRVTQ